LHLPWTEIVTSPQRRCSVLGEELAERLRIPLTVDVRLVEMNFGAWEGRAWIAIQEEDGGRLGAFFRDPRKYPPPDGERFATFERRVLAAWTAILRRERSAHVLVLTHGGTVRLILRQVLGLPIDRVANLLVAPGSGTRIGCDRSGGLWLLYHGGPLCHAPLSGSP
jgi:alpha-ribazole phosphatase/probable phosphoglycerate mutase